MPQDLSRCFPSIKNIQFSKEIPTVIIGSELLFTPNECRQKRNGRKLYQKIIFTDPETAKKINPEQITNSSESLKNSAVEESIKIITNLSLLESTRASVSDMFYVEPVFLQGKYFAGGAIDLVPVEISQHLAQEIITEKKQSYNPVEEALVRSVLGFSGNERLAETNQLLSGLQIDTTNIKQELQGHYLKKEIDWRKFEVSFSFPKSYQQFVKDMEIQWQYGFDQTIKKFKNR